jgi:glycosyltransferase involved in cell wall biosynthesis
MNSSVQISVVMPLYNNAKEVQRALRSVFNQTISEFEVLVVNDGSTDGGDTAVRMIDDKRIRVIDQKNKGVSAARNRGVAEAKGNLIAFLDADDEWKSNFLETIIRLQRNFTKCSVFATHYFYKEIDGTVRTPILRRVPPGMWEGVLENYFETAAYSDPPLWSSSLAIRKNALLSVGGFPEGVSIGEDLLTWARLAVNFEVAFSKKQCAVFWLRAPLAGYPTRTPEIPDVVGDRLAELIAKVNADQKRDFLRYLSMWHRMRASMFVQLQDRTDAMAEIRKMARYSKVNPQVYIYFLLALAPKMIRKFVLQIFTFVRTLRRTFRIW